MEIRTEHTLSVADLIYVLRVAVRKDHERSASALKACLGEENPSVSQARRSASREKISQSAKFRIRGRSRSARSSATLREHTQSKPGLAGTPDLTLRNSSRVSTKQCGCWLLGARFSEIPCNVFEENSTWEFFLTTLNYVSQQWRSAAREL